MGTLGAIIGTIIFGAVIGIMWVIGVKRLRCPPGR